MSLVSSNNRRDLYEWNYPVTKVLEVLEDCIVGDHYHKERDEVFILLNGKGTALIGDKMFVIKKFEEMHAPRGMKHTFYLEKGSILLEFATKEYDPTDDYKS
jgi:mannose-6-phosphate isomerase-like protein (cupin superfamily)